MEKKRSKKLLVAIGLVIVIAVGGVFAYFNQTMTVENPFDTGKYDSVLTEDFSPSDGQNWQPGVEVNKDIQVTNTGNYDILVRVGFDEKWVNKDTRTLVKENKGMDAATWQESATDGLTANDRSVVEKILNDENWVYNAADGYWYYKANLTAGAATGTFLDAVRLLEDADMGHYTVNNYYTSAEAKPDRATIGTDPAVAWVAYEGAVPDGAKHTMSVTGQDPAAPGYGNANYTLTITAQTVQATEAAMTDVFGLAAAPAGCNWIFN